jgi:HSP20 family protein
VARRSCALIDVQSKEAAMVRSLARSHPFEELFRDLSPGYFVRPLHGDPLPEPGQIRIDVKETDSAFTVQAEVPGVSRDDIQVGLDGARVTISAEVRQADKQSDDERTLREERYFGSVSRSLQLAQEIDEAAATAKVDNGVLTLVLPKRKSGAGRQLKVE